VLRLIVQLVMVGLPYQQQMPPPSSYSDSLSVIVQLVIVGLALLQNIAPSRHALLAVMIQLIMVGLLQAQWIPPPPLPWSSS